MGFCNVDKIKEGAELAGLFGAASAVSAAVVNWLGRSITNVGFLQSLGYGAVTGVVGGFTAMALEEFAGINNIFIQLGAGAVVGGIAGHGVGGALIGGAIGAGSGYVIGNETRKHKEKKRREAYRAAYYHKHGHYPNAYVYRKP